MDTDYRRRHCPRRRNSIDRVNIFVMIASLAAYGLNRFGIEHLTTNWFIHGYLNDVLAGVLLLGYTNALIVRTPMNHLTLTSPLQIFCLLSIAGMFWEFVTPLYRGGTSDPRDLVAYLCGGAIYFGVFRVATNRLTMRCSERLRVSR